MGDAKRRAYVGGVYYNLTPAITLVGEYINEKGDNLLGGIEEQKANSVSLGAILWRALAGVFSGGHHVTAKAGGTDAFGQGLHRGP